MKATGARIMPGLAGQNPRLSGSEDSNGASGRPRRRHFPSGEPMCFSYCADTCRRDSDSGMGSRSRIAVVGLASCLNGTRLVGAYPAHVPYLQAAVNVTRGGILCQPVAQPPGSHKQRKRTPPPSSTRRAVQAIPRQSDQAWLSVPRRRSRWSAP